MKFELELSESDLASLREAYWILQKVLAQVDKVKEEKAKEAPTPKQIQYAKDLARQKGLQEPDFTKVSRSELSAWIEKALRGG